MGHAIMSWFLLEAVQVCNLHLPKQRSVIVVLMSSFKADKNFK